MPHGPAAATSGSIGAAAAMHTLFVRDMRIALRRPADSGAVIIFYFIVVSLFPLGIGADPDQLRTLAPGVIWVAALLATMLSLPRVFADDYRDGTLEQLLLAPTPLPLLAFAKTAAHWASSGLPLALLSPLLALQFDLGPRSSALLCASLLLGTPLLSLIGAIVSGLTLGARGSGVLLSLLVLPLYVPVLVFGASAVYASASGMSAAAHLSLLGAMLALALVFSPWATAAALRIAAE